MVEFALVAPFFFFMIFAIIDGGLFLYGRISATDGAKTVSLAVAAKGTDVDADTFSIARVKNSPIGSSSVIQITEIDIYRAIQNGSGVLSPDGTSTCGNGTQSCRNRYNLVGTVLGSGAYWLPSQRNVTSPNTDFFGVDATYTYKSFTHALPNITTTVTLYFRLEPQQ